MNRRAWLVLLAVTALGAGYGSDLVPGRSTEKQVRASMGKVTLEKKVAGGGKVLWFSKLPYGHENWAARLDSKGVLVSLEQRLTDKYIARVRADKTTANGVVDLLGPPYRKVKLPTKNVVYWEYQLRPWPEPQTLYVEVSPDNVVRKVYTLRDRDTGRKFP